MLMVRVNLIVYKYNTSRQDELFQYNKERGRERSHRRLQVYGSLVLITDFYLTVLSMHWILLFQSPITESLIALCFIVCQTTA